MVRIAQLVRASDCGSEGRGFESELVHPKIRRVKITIAYTLRGDGAK